MIRPAIPRPSLFSVCVWSVARAVARRTSSRAGVARYYLGWLVRTAVEAYADNSTERTRSGSTAHTCERVSTSVGCETLGRPTRLGGSCDRDLERNDGALAAGAANGE